MAGIDNSSSGMDVTRDVPQVSERPRSATGNYNKDRDGQAWFSGSGLRRRLDKRGAAPKPRDQNADDAPQMQGSHAGAAASQLSRTAAGGLGMVALVALVVVALMLAGVEPMPRMKAQEAHVAESDVANYLRGIASWHEVARSDAGIDPYHTIMPTAEECAAADVLPAVQILCAAPQHAAFPSRIAPGSGAPDALASLSLDCGQAANSEACQLAAAMNSYSGSEEGGPEGQDLLEAHWSLAGALQRSNSDWPASALDSLALDCVADPAACAAAATVNSYEGEGAAVPDSASAADWVAQQQRAREEAAAAAAASDLRRLDLDCSAHHGDDYATVQAAAEKPGATGERARACLRSRSANRYEGEENWAATRAIAIQAAPHLVGTRYLELDCSDTDAAVQAECQRSKQANRYEGEAAATTPASPLAPADAGEASVALAAAALAAQPFNPAAAQAGRAAAAAHTTTERYAAVYRSLGYDIPAVEGASRQPPQQGESSCGCGGGHAHHHHDSTAPSESLPLLHDASAGGAADAAAEQQRYDAAPRTAGYDAPAVQPSGGDSGQAPRGSAGTGHAERLYYKQPCNSPSGRKLYFKSAKTAQHRRVYYKNAANAPMQAAEDYPHSGQMQHQTQQPSGSAPLTPEDLALRLAAQVAGAVLLGAAAGWVLMRERHARSSAAGRNQGRPTLQLRTAPSTTLEAAGQLLAEAAAGSGAGGGSDSGDAAPTPLGVHPPLPDHVDSPRATNFDSPRLAFKAQALARLEFAAAAAAEAERDRDGGAPVGASGLPK